MNLRQRLTYYQNLRKKDEINCERKNLRENPAVSVFVACHKLNIPVENSIELYPNFFYEKEKILFLDIETIGLGFSLQNWPFIIGLAYFKENYIETQQIFLSSTILEPDNLEYLEELWKTYSLLITYNGSTFDIPLLKTRYNLYRKNFPQTHLEHIDLYRIIRQIYPQKPRRLKDAERVILQEQRDLDMDGREIGQAYFEYQKFGDFSKIEAIMRHNLFDLLSLAKLALKLQEAIQEIKRGNRNLFFKMQRLKKAPTFFIEKAFYLDTEKESIDYFILAEAYEKNKNFRKAALLYAKAVRFKENKALERLLKILWRLKKYLFVKKLSLIYLPEFEATQQKKILAIQQRAEKKLKHKELKLF